MNETLASTPNPFTLARTPDVAPLLRSPAPTCCSGRSPTAVAVPHRGRCGTPVRGPCGSHSSVVRGGRRPSARHVEVRPVDPQLDDLLVAASRFLLLVAALEVVHLHHLVGDRGGDVGRRPQRVRRRLADPRDDVADVEACDARAVDVNLQHHREAREVDHLGMIAALALALAGRPSTRSGGRAPRWRRSRPCTPCASRGGSRARAASPPRS